MISLSEHTPKKASISINARTGKIVIKKKSSENLYWQMGSMNRTNVAIFDEDTIISNRFIPETSLKIGSIVLPIMKDDVCLVHLIIHSYSSNRAREISASLSKRHTCRSVLFLIPDCRESQLRCHLCGQEQIKPLRRDDTHVGEHERWPGIR